MEPEVISKQLHEAEIFHWGEWLRYDLQSRSDMMVFVNACRSDELIIEARMSIVDGVMISISWLITWLIPHPTPI